MSFIYLFDINYQSFLSELNFCLILAKKFVREQFLSSS